jgi:hypothetical protein
MRPPADRNTTRWENWLAALLLLGAAIWFGWAVTRAWNNGNLPGCEFRQAQTAVSAYWIQHDRDFSLAYPTPVLGKPWSIPMEFPLYQWTVVAVSDLAGYPLVQSARAVSLASLVLALPAVWILLRRFGLPPARRVLLVALVLTCPLLVFYARSFLIETMALMFALWFVAAFGEAMHTRKLGWLLLANLAGAGAGTVKVTTFILYLVPAACWGAWLLWRTIRERAGSWRPALEVLARGIGCVVVPFAVTVAWTHYADAVKALNPNGAFLASGNMTGFNFGLGLFDLRFSADAWRAMFNFWSHGILAAPLALATAALAALFGGRWRWPALACLALFFLAQFVFPLLYAWHEYYFVANAALLVLAAGFALCGLLEQARLRWLGWALALGLLAAQGHLFLATYLRPHLSYASNGGTMIPNILAELTFPDEVLVIAGEDWDSSTPFYARRRALMIRRNTETDWTGIERAFNALADDRVAALILTGDQRNNTGLIERAASLGIDPRPVFSFGETTVRLHRDMLAELSADIRTENYAGITWYPLGDTAAGKRILTGREIETATLRPRDRLLFSMMSPEPLRFFSQFGAGTSPLDGGRIFNANPLTRLWFRAPRDNPTGLVQLGIMPGAYSDPASSTDGIEFRVSALASDGQTLRPLFSRQLNPRDVPADRGTVTLHFPVSAPAGATLLVEVLPGPANDGAYDWSYIAKLELR